MKKRRKILAVIVALCMIIGLIILPGSEKQVMAEVFENYEYMLDTDGTVIIKKYTGTDENLTIPAVIDGRAVSFIWANAFAGCTSLSRVVISDGITIIGSGAFSGCSGLVEIDIPASVTRIDPNAFEGCENLKQIRIPDGMTAIENDVFSGCTGLAEVNIPNSVITICSDAFEECTALREIRIPDGVTTIGEGAFINCTALEKINIPDKLSVIRLKVFSGCTGLTEISIPESVTQVEDFAFEECINLRKISIPASIQNIGNAITKNCLNLQEIVYAGTAEQWDKVEIGYNNDELLNAVMHFNNNTSNGQIDNYEYKNLTDGTIEVTKYVGSDSVIEIPAEIEGKKITSIGQEAFRLCADITKVTIPDGVTNIGKQAFWRCAGLTEVTLPSSVVSIGYAAFCDCSSLREILIPDTVRSIEDHLFDGCGSLKEVIIPDSVVSIGEAAFQFCTNLGKIRMSDNVASIGELAFNGCEKLMEINLSYKIDCIERGVFWNCSSLEKISLPNDVTSIKGSAFISCYKLTQIRISKNLEKIESNAFFYCDRLEDVYYSGTEEQWNNIQIDSKGNESLRNAQIHFNEEEEPAKNFEYKILSDKTIEITKYNGCNTTVAVPAVIDNKYVTSIGDQAFRELTDIEKISLPDSIVSIGNASFRGCKRMRQINIPSEVTLIEAFAFDGCAGLEKISFPNGITKISAFAYRGCSSLKEVSIPNSIDVMGDSAFADCTSLEMVNLPDNIEVVGIFLFSGCTGLTEINIPNGVIDIADHAFEDCTGLSKINLPVSLRRISLEAFNRCSNLTDIYYAGTKEQWEKVIIAAYNNEPILNAVMHFKDALPDIPDNILPSTGDAKQELHRLKEGESFAIEQDFGHYLSEEQIDIMESCLYTWLAEVNASYKYSGPAAIRELLMKKSGIDPNGDPMSGMEKAIMHITAETTYGPKTFEFTLDVGKPDSNGDLYPAYGAMQYEILEKNGIPSDLPKSGAVGRTSYADLGAFAESVRKASEDSLHSTYQWQQLSNEMIAGILADKTVTEIIGNKNGSFSDGTMTVYAKPLFTYSKKVTIACPVDVYIYGMDGTEAGTIINNKPSGGNGNVRLDVNGDSKTVYLSGNDYYLNLRGTDTGTMRYEVEEIANEEVRRNVQFLELQLQKDMQYEGYVFRPLNIDSDLYALRTVGGSSQEVFYADQDTYQALFKRIQGLALSQKNTALEADKTVQLNASLSPLDASNPNLKWITDNESVAKVDNNGLVTAVGAGRATVTVATKDGSFLKQFCVIDVADKAGNNSGSAGSGSGGASGWYGGGNSADTEQEKTPVVVKLHYVVQFQANGGTNLSRKTMTLLAGDSPGIMPKVQRRDYLFEGWYTQQNGGARVTGEEPLKEAATLYAQWKKAEAPGKAASLTLKSKKKGQLQVNVKKVSGAAGYQIVYSNDKKFAAAKTKKQLIAANQKTIVGLKSGKTYYVKVRAYSVDSMGNKLYGAYSTVTNTKIK